MAISKFEAIQSLQPNAEFRCEDDVIKECRDRRYFEKPSAKKRRRMKEAKFKAMLDARDALD